MIYLKQLRLLSDAHLSMFIVNIMFELGQHRAKKIKSKFNYSDEIDKKNAKEYVKYYLQVIAQWQVSNKLTNSTKLEKKILRFLMSVRVKNFFDRIRVNLLVEWSQKILSCLLKGDGPRCKCRSSCHKAIENRKQLGRMVEDQKTKIGLRPNWFLWKGKLLVWKKLHEIN